MKSVPNLLFFKPMKEEPSSGIRKSPFVKSGLEDGHGRELKPPYLPGEKCYVRETWGSNMVKGYEGYGKIFYRADMPDQKTVPETYGCPWRSPATMPQWAARRFVVVLSCEPVRVSEVTEEDCKRMGVNWVHEFICDWLEKHPGKEWAWRVEGKEEK